MTGIKIVTEKSKLKRVAEIGNVYLRVIKSAKMAYFY